MVLKGIRDTNAAYFGIILGEKKVYGKQDK
jgi:hypothetical protein